MPAQPLAPGGPAAAAGVGERWERLRHAARERAPTLACASSVVMTGLALALYTQNRGVPGAEPFFDPVAPAVALVFPALGAYLVSRCADSRVGWLFCSGGLLGVALFADQYAAYTTATSPGSLPGGAWVAWLGSWLWVPGSLAPRTLLFVLYPTGRPPSRRWSRGGRALLLAVVTFTALAALANLPGRDGSAALRSLPHLAGVVLPPIALVGLAGRYRRSAGEEREQLRWFTAAAALVALVPVAGAGLAVAAPGAFAAPWLRYLYQALGVVSLLGLAASAALAVVRRHLYELDPHDVDALVRRATVHAGLAVSMALVYWGATGVLGAGLLEGVLAVKPGLSTSLLAVAAVAVAWHPVRRLLEAGLDRLRYDKLAAEALGRLGHRLESTLTPDEVLPAIVDTIASALRLPYVAVEVTSGDEVIASAAHGQARPADLAVKLVHQNEEIGRLVVATGAGPGRLGDVDHRLLDQLAGQAGVAASVVRLTAELQRSRSRVVAAADAERRRIERNIHDGAQQHLVALAVNLRLARDLGQDDPEQARAMLDQMAADVRQTLQELRDLAHGIYPPLLADSGLDQALRAAVHRFPFDAVVDTSGTGRYAPEVEAAVYFCCLEALQNAAKHAGPATSVAIHLRQADGVLSFTVADDGTGFDPAVVAWNDGLTNMSDRLGAIGGTLHVDSEPGHGTRVSGVIPLAWSESLAGRA